eukprot:GEMP01030919.1.p1 GENE.GEMP01030919.1~~GEMP01030919.1.p1  ORF type:complete len:519 (+),score=92.38 GEMP01030919.1:99-1655(+)
MSASSDESSRRKAPKMRVTALYKGRVEEFEINPTNLAGQLTKVARDQFGIGLKAVQADEALEISLEDLDNWVFDSELRLRLIGDLDHCLYERRTENEIRLTLRCKNEPCRVSDLGGHGAMFTLPAQGKEVTYRPSAGTWKLIRCERSPDGIVAVLVRSSCTVFISAGGEFSEETVHYGDIHCHAGEKLSFLPKIKGSPSLFRASPKLPGGLLVDPVTGRVSGIPTSPKHGSTFTIAWNDNQESTATLHVLPTASLIKHFDCNGIPRGICGVSEFVYVAVEHCLKRFHVSSGIVEMLAGADAPGFQGDELPANLVRFDSLMGLCAHEDHIYICDANNHRVRKYSIKNKVVTTIAGKSVHGSSGDGGPAVDAALSCPYDCCVHEGHLYIAERTGKRIRVVDLSTGIISTYCPDVELISPQGLTIFNGEVVTSDFTASRLTIMSKNHVLGPYPEMLCPVGVFGTERGIYVCDMTLHRVVHINPLKGCSEVLNVALDKPWGIIQHKEHMFVTDSDRSCQVMV